MTAETLPNQESESLEAKKPGCNSGPTEDKVTEENASASALKRKRTDNEENQDSKPTLKKFHKEVVVLEPFGKATASSLVEAPSNLKKIITDQTSLSTSRATTSTAATTEASRNSSPQLSLRSTTQTSIRDSELSPRLLTKGDGALKLVCRLQQAVDSNGGPNPQNPMAGLVYPKFQTGPQPMPGLTPSYSNHANLQPDLNSFQRTYQQLQQHFTAADVPPHLNLLPVAPGQPLPLPPQTQLPISLQTQCQSMWSPPHPLPPTTPSYLTANANTSTPGQGGRCTSKTIERFANILVDLIEWQTARAFSLGCASCQSQTKVDQGVQTDLPEIQTTGAGTQTGDKLEVLDIETMQVTSTPESESGHHCGYGLGEDSSEGESIRCDHQ